MPKRGGYVKYKGRRIQKTRRGGNFNKLKANFKQNIKTMGNIGKGFIKGIARKICRQPTAKRVRGGRISLKNIIEKYNRNQISNLMPKLPPPVDRRTVMGQRRNRRTGALENIYLQNNRHTLPSNKKWYGRKKKREGLW